ncbi:MAG: AAA family ATPase [Phycisphaeraceae bacterium]|nr:AAA family ATPase [Phycisphaeraceae bacterium]
MIQSPECLDATQQLISTPEVFGSVAHVAIWETVCRLSETGEPTLPAIEAVLNSRGMLEQVGGIDYLIALIEETAINPRPAEARALAEVVVEHYTRRRAAHLSQQLIDGDIRTQHVAAELHEITRLIEAGKPAEIFPIGQINNTMSPPVIDGLLRAGETMNVIAAPKVGKSWLVYSLLACIASGRRWLDTYYCTAGPVLLIDNELHPQTIANRLPKVTEAMGIEAPLDIDVLSLRGKGVTLDRLGPYINRIEQGYYKAIVLDAWYRFVPKGLSENSNADVMGLYNLLDEYAEQTGAAMVLIHHSSKGSQGDKSVTDVGAGAGSQSRAADAHVVLRPHEDEGHVVLEAAVRSFAPIDPVGLRWEFPLWRCAEDLDTSALKDRKTKGEQRHAERAVKDMETAREHFRKHEAIRPRQLRDLTGWGHAKATGVLDKMHAAGEITFNEIKVRGNQTREYKLSS